MTFWQALLQVLSETRAVNAETDSRLNRYRSSQANPISPDPNIYTYRTRNGLNFFQFSYHDIGGKFEIDIHLMPPFNGRSQDLHTIHVLPSSRQAQYKICVHSGKEPQTQGAAKELSKLYAELINTYIETGVTPDTQIAHQ